MLLDPTSLFCLSLSPSCGSVLVQWGKLLFRARMTHVRVEALGAQQHLIPNLPGSLGLLLPLAWAHCQPPAKAKLGLSLTEVQSGAGFSQLGLVVHK